MNTSKEFFRVAFALGMVVSGYILYYLGQTWNRDDMALLRSHIHSMRIEQDKPRLIEPMDEPKERSSTTADQKVLNKYYKMEKPVGKVPSLPGGNK